jgi:hypothetical protein
VVRRKRRPMPEALRKLCNVPVDPVETYYDRFTADVREKQRLLYDWLHVKLEGDNHKARLSDALLEEFVPYFSVHYYLHGRRGQSSRMMYWMLHEMKQLVDAGRFVTEAARLVAKKAAKRGITVNAGTLRNAYLKAAQK